MEKYIKVSDDLGNIIEIPSDEDGTISLPTLISQFNCASGLKYQGPNGFWRALRIENDKIIPPKDFEKWDEILYRVVQLKENKRKIDDCIDENMIKLRKKTLPKKCNDLIVLGLNPITTPDSMKKVFLPYGNVILAEVKKDSKTGKAKGYGFIRFSNYESQLKVLMKKFNIDGRWCTVKLPDSKGGNAALSGSKIFIGGVDHSMTASDLKSFFESSFDTTVVDVFFVPAKNYAFVTFLDWDTAHSLYGESFEINGKSVFCRPAEPVSDNYNKTNNICSNNNAAGVSLQLSTSQSIVSKVVKNGNSGSTKKSRCRKVITNQTIDDQLNVPCFNEESFKHKVPSKHHHLTLNLNPDTAIHKLEGESDKLTLGDISLLPPIFDEKLMEALEEISRAKRPNNFTEDNSSNVCSDMKAHGEQGKTDPIMDHCNENKGSCIDSNHSVCDRCNDNIQKILGDQTSSGNRECLENDVCVRCDHLYNSGSSYSNLIRLQCKPSSKDAHLDSDELIEDFESSTYLNNQSPFLKAKNTSSRRLHTNFGKSMKIKLKENDMDENVNEQYTFSSNKNLELDPKHNISFHDNRTFVIESNDLLKHQMANHFSSISLQNNEVSLPVESFKSALSLGLKKNDYILDSLNHITLNHTKRSRENELEESEECCFLTKLSNSASHNFPVINSLSFSLQQEHPPSPDTTTDFVDNVDAENDVTILSLTHDPLNFGDIDEVNLTTLRAVNLSGSNSILSKNNTVEEQLFSKLGPSAIINNGKASLAKRTSKLSKSHSVLCVISKLDKNFNSVDSLSKIKSSNLGDFECSTKFLSTDSAYRNRKSVIDCLSESVLGRNTTHGEILYDNFLVDKLNKSHHERCQSLPENINFI
ncbi:unnamed protein product [Gordionus sp. m RMFG-2023]|uniref:uncharacterized protein LOC135926140 n=1 Tax=Gordionus sp. m RMFG-2023 TaxID=3053472 RepID=UPI0030E54844